MLWLALALIVAAFAAMKYTNILDRWKNRHGK